MSNFIEIMKEKSITISQIIQSYKGCFAKIVPRESLIIANKLNLRIFNRCSSHIKDVKLLVIILHTYVWLYLF